MNKTTTILGYAGAIFLSAVATASWLLPATAETPVYAYTAADEAHDYSSAEAAMAVDDYPSVEPINSYERQSDEVVEAYDDGAVEIVILTTNELADVIGPIALYPDDLLAIVLPASTYPLEIVQAARFLDDYDADKSLEPDENWDESVTALLNYPEVLRMMRDDIDWTWKLGGAVLNQQPDVIEAVESFRDRAYAAGNLKSDDYQTVAYDDGNIEITPVNEEVIYVPYYEPRRVVIRQVEPVYYYYPRPYPVYYYPYPAGYSFSNGFFWGVTTAYRIGWSTRHLHVHHHSYWDHPYYGHRYFNHYYRQPSITVYNNWYVNNSGRYSSNRNRHGDRWRPRPNSHSRPGNPSRPDGQIPRRPDRPDRDRPNVAAAGNLGAVAGQRPIQRPGTVSRDRDADLSARREGPDRRRDRELVTRGNNRDNSPVISGQSERERATKPRDQIRFRDRPDTMRKPGGETRFRDNPDTNRKPRDEIRFRDRPEPVTASTQPGARPNNAGMNTARPQGGQTASGQTGSSRDRARVRQVALTSERDRVQQKPDRPRYDRAPPVATAPSVATRPSSYRQPVKPAGTSVQRKPAMERPDVQRRPATQRADVYRQPAADRATQRKPTRQTERAPAQPKPRAVERSSRESQAQSGARERKDTGAGKKPAGQRTRPRK